MIFSNGGLNLHIARIAQRCQSGIIQILKERYRNSKKNFVRTVVQRSPKIWVWQPDYQRSLFLASVRPNHRLYGSTSCCISHRPSQWERSIFDPHSSESPGPIFMKLKIYNYLPDIPHAKNFRGLRQRGWSGQIASLTHESFCLFFVPSPRPQIASLDTLPHAIACGSVSFIRRSGQGSAFWGL